MKIRAGILFVALATAALAQPDARLRALFPADHGAVARYGDTPAGYLMKFFRLEYNERRAEVMARLDRDPVLYLPGDGSLQLWHGGRREKFALDHGAWSELATISHTPLDVHLLVADHLGRPLPSLVRSRLALLRDLCATARADLARRAWTTDLRASQERLLAHTEGFARRLLRRREVDKAELDRFVRTAMPDISRGIEGACSAAIEGLYSTTMRARRRLTADEWARARVLIQAAAAPRAESFITLFYAKALGEPSNGGALLPGESRRVYYFEDSPRGEPGARLALGTAMTDELFSADFFGDPLHMRRDATRAGTRKKLAAMGDRLPIR